MTRDLESLGKDQRWDASLRSIAGEVIGAAPSHAQYARCTVSGTREAVYCNIEYGPELGNFNVSESLYYSAVNLVSVWFDHVDSFPGLEVLLSKQPDGDWQVGIDFHAEQQAAAEQHSAAAEDGWDQDQGGYQQAGTFRDDEFEGGSFYQDSASAEADRRGGYDPEEEEQEEPAPAKPAASRRRGNVRGGMVQSETGIFRTKKLSKGMIALASAICVLLIGGIAGGIYFYMANQKPPEPPKSLVQLRAEFRTKLTKKGPSPQEYDNRAPDTVKEVTYPSDGRELLAWLVLPDREPPFPAVVYAHGGFALTRADYEYVMPFLAHGFAVLIPSWRSENGNEGDFEMCYGEVDDLVNAIDYLATRKKIDPRNIYGAGHDSGATSMMMAAALSPHLRKVAVCGGIPDMLDAGVAYEHAPFDRSVEQEMLMRSPARFVDELKCPMLLIYGAQDDADQFFMKQAKKMEEASKKQPVLVEAIPGKGHQTALVPALERMITFFEGR